MAATYEETKMKSPKVFLNFRGAELRQSFISHLEVALIRGGVNVFVDQPLYRGLESLFKGIEESSVALVILSERYTESKWCLNELVKIKERVEQGKLIAIPIFYKLNPSQVKNLDGDFGSYLWDLGKGTEFDKLKRWKEALEFVSGNMGLVLNDKSDEAALIDDIVKKVHMALSFLPRETDSLPTEPKLPGKDSDVTPELQDTEEKKQENVSESSAMVTYDQKHQVYINFRGMDTRHHFVSHLKHALKMNGVSFFLDEMEVKGVDLGNLFKRIEESKLALVIFSSRYTESAWCLNELVKIEELRDEGKLVAIPIFYKVEPSQVKKLTGVFGDNFRSLCRMNQDHHINTKWMKALRSMASTMGFYLNEHSSESEFIIHIVKEVLKIITQQEGEKPSFFGMEQRMEQLEYKLDFDGNDTQIIGVVGMPGIGKTTLAMMLHEKWKRKFISCVTYLGISKNSEDDRPVQLRRTLLEDLLKGKVPEIGDETTHGSVKVELLKTKIFALLDDVSDKRQLEFLLGELDWIKKGSKIIITTCDKSLLEGFADDTYVVPKLNDREAFQLFSYHAFHGQNFNSTSSLLTLSRMFVDYARGHPLTLKLLGRELYEKDEVHWAPILEMLTKQSNRMFQGVGGFSTDQLKLSEKQKDQDVGGFSTDQLKLTEKQKDAFLDIVCFFKSEDEYFVRSLLDSGDPDSTNSVSEVKDLVNKFLITIAGGRVEMNVPLYTFSKDLGSPRWLRLWNYEDIINKLMKMKKSDTNNVRGIFLDTSKLTKSMCLDISTFTDMRNLRYMKIYDSCCPRQCKAECKLNFPDGLEFPLGEVRYLHWVKFPLEELPPEFRPENLVDLRLPYSKITRVWEGEKDTPRLKWVDLSHSSELLDLSALSKAENLQRLNLEGCTSLDKLPVEIQNMKSLVFLNLRGCIRLWSLPEMNLISLKTLILSDCSNLEEFQLISESVEFLHLDGTAIKGLPQAIQKLQRLVVLNLKNCKLLACLPNCLGNLKALDKLILSGCSRLKNLPDVRNSLKHLHTLLFDGTGAKEMPSISCFTGSEGPASADMFLQPLGSMTEWPCAVNRVSSLRRLCLSGNDFVSLQPDIGKLYNLKWLDVKHCTKLRSVPMLPPKLQYFDAHGCDSLKRVADPIAFSVLSDQIHATFSFSNCNKLDQEAKDSIISYTRWRSQLVRDELTQYNGGLVSEALIGTCFPGWEIPACFSHQASGSMLNPKLPAHWCDNKFTGIGLCAVILFDGYHNQRKRVLLKCNIEFKKEDGSSNHFSCTIGGWSEPSDTPRKLVSSHVFIGFTSRLDINKISEDDVEEKCVCTETFIKFEVTDGMEAIEGCEVVKCGFSLVNAPEERPCNSNRGL
ncbi:NB-ARC [Arabidopsis thaliana x Arabidopsis arenosa]|uniref:NB-ARC n=1 Tax=Arabidopsis thaliana x Arabidopsis arenosa TaxID=1240361 RepID=A0A8T2A2V7_9BRAS|nr:NB-ARC [Arabidopsis thaliana x Arabidopsis arenosa]